METQIDKFENESKYNEMLLEAESLMLEFHEQLYYFAITANKFNEICEMSRLEPEILKGFLDGDEKYQISTVQFLILAQVIDYFIEEQQCKEENS